MRILTGYMPPSSGSAQIAGQDVLTSSLEARQQIGYLPETVPLYTDMPVGDYLSYMGKLRGLEQPRLGRRIDEVIDLVHVAHYRDTLISKLSKGYRQRVGLAQAILHEPQVLILDEPTIGIDPIQVVETRQLIKDLGREHTLLLSSHILHEVSTVCQRVLIIHEGTLVAEDSPANLAERLQATDRVEADGPRPQQGNCQSDWCHRRRRGRPRHRLRGRPRLHRRVRPRGQRPRGDRQRRGAEQLGPSPPDAHLHEPGGDLPPAHFRVRGELSAPH